MTQFSFEWILSLNWLSQFWGQVQDAGGRSALDRQGRLYVTGSTDSLQFPVTTNAIQPTHAEATDNFPSEDAFLAILEIPLAGPEIQEIVDGGSFKPEITGAAWVTIRGARLASTTRIWAAADFVGNAMPSRLDGVSVTIDGKAAAVYYVSPTQLNVLAPALTRTGPVPVAVTTSAGTATVMATVRMTVPSWFMLDPENRRYVAAVNLDGTIVGKPSLYPSAPGATRPVSARGRALIFGTGWGDTNPGQPDGQAFSGAYPLLDNGALVIKVGGIAAAIEFAGVIGPGLYQFNIVLPDLTPGDYLIEGSLGQASTQSGAYITVGPPL